MGCFVLTKTRRVGMIIQLALAIAHGRSLGHNVPLISYGRLRGWHGALAVVAGVICRNRPWGPSRGWAFCAGDRSCLWTIVIGGLGFAVGGVIASVLIGWITTFCQSYNIEMENILSAWAFEPRAWMNSIFADLIGSSPARRSADILCLYPDGAGPHLSPGRSFRKRSS